MKPKGSYLLAAAATAAAAAAAVKPIKSHHHHSHIVTTRLSVVGADLGPVNLTPVAPRDVDAPLDLSTKRPKSQSSPHSNASSTSESSHSSPINSNSNHRSRHPTSGNGNHNYNGSNNGNSAHHIRHSHNNYEHHHLNHHHHRVSRHHDDLDPDEDFRSRDERGYTSSSKDVDDHQLSPVSSTTIHSNYEASPFLLPYYLLLAAQENQQRIQLLNNGDHSNDPPTNRTPFNLYTHPHYALTDHHHLQPPHPHHGLPSLSVHHLNNNNNHHHQHHINNSGNHLPNHLTHHRLNDSVSIQIKHNRYAKSMNGNSNNGKGTLHDNGRSSPPSHASDAYPSSDDYSPPHYTNGDDGTESLVRCSSTATSVNHGDLGSLNQERKRISRPLTGKHVKHGTGASPSTLLTLRNMIAERQRLRQLGLSTGVPHKNGKRKANGRK